MSKEQRDAFVAGAWWHLMMCKGALTSEKAHDESKNRYPDVPVGDKQEARIIMAYECESCGEKFALKGSGWHFKENGSQCGKIVSIDVPHSTPHVHGPGYRYGKWVQCILSDCPDAPPPATPPVVKRWRCTKCGMKGKSRLYDGMHHDLWTGQGWCGPVVAVDKEG
jgi:ribosomal protein L44E